MMGSFQAHHICIGPDEMKGNGDLGRVFFLPGSDSRAQQIAERFHDATRHPSPRQINAWLGVVRGMHGDVDVGVISTGMGCPSLGIVVTELVLGGARRLLRVGSAGSVQPQHIKAGTLVIATAAVRDEGTSDAYAPREVPAVAHPDWVEALSRASRRLGLDDRTYAGVVHTKDSLYGREFATGPQAHKNRDYMEMLGSLGVMATEMESAHLFMLAAAHNATPRPLAVRASDPGTVKAGTILAVIGDDPPFAPPDVVHACETRAIDVACQAAQELMLMERGTL